jgi:hypothetical protein
MNKLNLMLTASPVEFAASFGEVTDDATTDSRGSTTGVHQDGEAVATEECAGGNGSGGARNSREVQFFSLEASIGTLGETSN